MLLGVTGCLYVFQHEITNIYYQKQLEVVIKPDSKPLPLSVLTKRAKLALPKDQQIGFITTYANPKKAWEFGSYTPGNAKAFWYFDAVKTYDIIWLNPFDGTVTLHKNYKYDFFNVVKMLHWSLLINHPIGQQIVGWCTMIFVVMLLTGLVLWWPKNLKKANFNKSFKVKWDASFKRLNYDLHNVPGFYALFIALVLGITGLVWAFSWFQKGVYNLVSLNQPAIAKQSFTSDTTKANMQNGLDLAFETAKNQFANYARMMINPAADSKSPIYVFGHTDEETYYRADELQLDQYTGKLLARNNYSDKIVAEKLYGMNYDIHVGAILGITGKIIAFFASFIAASLPITGFIIWRGRKKRIKPKMD